MSSRQIRRFREQLQAAKLENKKSEEEDFEPLYMHTQKLSYDLLTPENSTRNEEDQEIGTPKKTNLGFSMLFNDSAEEQEDDEVASDESPPIAVMQKKNKNNRKKKNKRNRRNENQAATPAEIEMDEIERAVAEVNSIMGEPQGPSGADKKAADDGAGALLKINHKYLSPEDEFSRRFGRDFEEPISHHRPDMLRLCRRHIVLPSDTSNLSISGLNMVQINVKDDVKYFKYVHSAKYQAGVRGLIADVNYHLASLRTDNHIYSPNTVEAIIQNVDLYFMVGEITTACNMLDALILFLQNNFCPSFNYFDGKTRLEYKHVENRAFHLILLKFIYLSTNKACHRTALEIAKLLLSLDPSDPLAVIFVIDTLALRAREHQWLVDVYRHWEREKDAGILFHMLYSHALAKYHLYLKTKTQENLEAANHHLKDAMVKFPNVAIMILAHCCVKNPTITEHEFFTKQWNTTESQDLQNLQELYVKLAGPKWREGKIMNWFADNAQRLTQEYDRDPAVQVITGGRAAASSRLKLVSILRSPSRLPSAGIMANPSSIRWRPSSNSGRFLAIDVMWKAACATAANVRHSLFKQYPIEIMRHLFAIRSMSDLLIDSLVPIELETFGFNPYPVDPNMVDEHVYFKVPTTQAGSGRRHFFVVPEY